jgi:hypothetical protein
LEFTRRGGAAGPWLLGIWLAASLVWIVPALAWDLDYFRNPGPEFHRLIVFAAPAWFAAALACGWFRPPALRRAEPWLLTGLAVAAPLVWKPLAAATALLLLCAALAIGRGLLDRFPALDATPLERFALSAGAGFALLIFLLMAAGLAGGLRLPVLTALLGLPPLALAGPLRRCGADLLTALRDWSDSAALDHPIAGLASALAVPFIAIVAALSLAPAIAHDALMLHLPASLHYLAAGRLEPLPHLTYTYFPQGAELLMTAAAAFGGQPAAQLVQPLFFALTLAALACVAARAGVSPLARHAGVLLAATLPFLVWTGGVTKNDMPMALFQTLSLLCLLRARDSHAKAWLRLGVVFLAASFSVKHTAAFGGVPLGLLYLWRLRTLPGKARELLLWAAGFAALAGVWQLRAFLLTGNPFFPVELSWAVESLRPNSMRPPGWRSIPYWKIPWTVHFDGTAAFESPSPNPAGFFLWLFGPLWLLVRRNRSNTAEAYCLVFAWMYFFYWGSVWPVLRYAIVPLGLAVVLTAERLAQAWRLLPRGWGPPLTAAVALNGVVCLLAAMIFSVNAPQLALFSGRIDEGEYLRRTLFTFPVLERLSQENTPGDWTLAVGNTAAAYAPDPSRYRCEFLARTSQAREAVPRLLLERQYAFLLLKAGDRAAVIARELPAGVTAREIYRDQRFLLYRLTYSSAAVPQ